MPPLGRGRDVLGQINWVLFVEEELRGNHEDYYDPRNSYLNEVLDRRLGIPISLSVIYWAVAELLGLASRGPTCRPTSCSGSRTASAPGSSTRSTRGP